MTAATCSRDYNVSSRPETVLESLATNLETLSFAFISQ